MTYDELQTLPVNVGSSYTELEQAIRALYVSAYYRFVDCSPHGPEIPSDVAEDLLKLFALVGLPEIE